MVASAPAMRAPLRLFLSTGGLLKADVTAQGRQQQAASAPYPLIGNGISRCDGFKGEIGQEVIESLAGCR